MIDEDKRMQGVLELFGPVLPNSNLFFATRQTQEFYTPALLKALYREPMLVRAFAKFKQDFENYVKQQPQTPVVQEKQEEVKTVPKKVVPPAPKATKVVKDGS